MCFESLFVAIVSTIRAVEQDVVFKVLTMNITEVALVCREVL